MKSAKAGKTGNSVPDARISTPDRAGYYKSLLLTDLSEMKQNINKMY